MLQLLVRNKSGGVFAIPIDNTFTDYNAACRLIDPNTTLSSHKTSLLVEEDICFAHISHTPNYTEHYFDTDA
ncbi:hypothetical protein [Labilibacter marinus]|uniref:hypothetical protein n=1 Tax=Labilibacter marinus TaxID=1477105 RepID=UPI00117B53A1|nr:hypothetical protein [Labilibacter marinus]